MPAKEKNAVAPELIVDIDVNDEVASRKQPLTADDLAALVAQLKAQGTQTILVRCGCTGLLPYHTRLSYPMTCDPAQVRAFGPHALAPDVEKYIVCIQNLIGRYAEVLRHFNPPEVILREGRRQGLKVLFWIDLFDDGVPGRRSKFLDEHPHCRWVGRDGRTFFHGLVDYAWPEARAFRVAQVKELLELEPDGIHCSTSAHSRHLPNVHELDYFGYSRPVVEAFQQRYGVDIRSAADFERQAWHDLKGEAMLELYRALAAVCHGRGKELWIGLQLGRNTQFTVDPHWSTHAVARYANHWQTLVAEGIADAFILGDYELGSQPAHPYWSLKTDIDLAPGQTLYAWAAEHYRARCRGKTKLYLFSEWLPGDVAGLDRRLAFFADAVRQNGFDGIDVHEAANFEPSPAHLPALGRLAERLRTADRKR